MLFLYILGSFLKVNVQNRNILGVAKFSNIFFGMPDIFVVNSRCWVQAYVARQIENTPLRLNHITGGGGGGTLIFSYIPKLGPFFGSKF